MLERPTSGDVVFEGRPLADLTGDALRKYRHSVAAVFQNPYSSLDPRLRIWQTITEQQAIERAGSKKARRARADELLELVGLGARMAERYPTSCRAASASASPSPAPSPWTRRWSSSTSRCRPSTSR